MASDCPNIDGGSSGLAGVGGTGGAAGVGGTGGSAGTVVADAGADVVDDRPSSGDAGGSGGGTSDASPQDAQPEAAVCPPNADLTADLDHDGYTIGDGDCNDCDPNINPGAFDFPDNNVDEDCNGVPDDEPTNCADMLAMDDNDPMNAAYAIDLCKITTHDAMGINKTWGVISAAYVFPDGTTMSTIGNNDPPNPQSHGILPSFGTQIAPKLGPNMLALSSGIARSGTNGSSPGGANMGTSSATPTGFPTPSPSCGDNTIGTDPVANDAIALEVVIRTPTNAKAFNFDFNFYTYEYSTYVCSQFNDFFVALLTSNSPSVPMNHNIAFDSQLNPVSVNNGFLEVCSPTTIDKGNVMKQFTCPLGTGELDGTGFEGHAATGWLSTQSNIEPGEEITVRFAVWDAGDHVLDTTVLLDRFQWLASGGATQTFRP